MYETYFGFRERPFELTPNPRFVVMTASHREALSNLQYAIASRKAISLLIGDAGTGKTTVIRTAIEQQLDRVSCIHIANPALTRAEFIEMLGSRFSLSREARHSKAAFLLELERLLQERRRVGETTVLIIDEAQSVSLELLEELRLLANIESNEEKLLSIVLAGQPELSDRLNDDTLRQLKQRISLRCLLAPLSLQETAAYLAGRIRAAGGVGAQVFTRDAVTLIHDRTRGIPRSINVVADNSLLTAFAKGERPVTRQTVLDVCTDFDLRQAAGADDAAPILTPEHAEPRVTPGESTAPVPSLIPRSVEGTATNFDSLLGAADQQTSEEAAPKRRRFSFFRG